MFITNVTDFLFMIVVSCDSGKSKRSDVSNDKDEDDEGSVDGGVCSMIPISRKLSRLHLKEALSWA